MTHYEFYLAVREMRRLQYLREKSRTYSSSLDFKTKRQEQLVDDEIRRADDALQKQGIVPPLEPKLI